MNYIEIIKNIGKELQKENFFNNRMISNSKSFYRKAHPFNTVIFNSNINIKTEEGYKKVWSGDLDITFDGKILKNIAKKTNTTLYVMQEMITEKPIWNTNQDVPYIDNFLYKLLKKKNKLKNRIYKIENKISEHNKKIINNKIKIEKPTCFLNKKIIKEIKFNYSDLEKFIIDNKDKFSHMKKLVLNMWLDEFISKKINKPIDEIDYSLLWVTKKTAKKLLKKAINLQVIHYKDSYENYEDYSYYHIAFAVFSYDVLTKYNINKKSLNDCTIYMLD